MPKPNQPALVLSEAEKELVRGIMTEAEIQLLRRVRDYLARGRPLATLPLLSLRAQWIDAFLAVFVREDDSRAQEFTDLRTEFDLRGLDTPARQMLPEVTRFDDRFRKERPRRKRDPAALDRFNNELDALCDRLMAEDRAALME